MKRGKKTWQPIVFGGAIIVVLILLFSGIQIESIPNVGGETGSECTTDKDCRTAGCSGQICTTAANARGIFTTCEYKEEYDCLKKTSCSCVDGYCKWEENEEYKKCLADLNE